MLRDVCQICFEEKPLGSLQPCGHTMCPQCIHKLLHNAYRCPFCRDIFVDSKPPLVVFDESKRISLVRGRSRKYGLGLRQLDNGVVCISSVEKYGRAKRAGVKVNTAVLGVNGLPCYNKDCVVALLKSVNESSIFVDNIRGS